VDVLRRRSLGRLPEDAQPQQHLFSEDADALFHAAGELTRLPVPG
jgi:hypothetical protein